MSPRPIRTASMWAVLVGLLVALPAGCGQPVGGPEGAGGPEVDPPSAHPPAQAMGLAVKFAGITDLAGRIAYVVDTTGANTETFPYVQAALLRSIESLQPGQRFALIFFGATSPNPLKFNDRVALVPATRANQQSARRFILAHREAGPAEEGAAWRAMRLAFDLEGGRPQVLFLLAQRPWAGWLAERVGQLNSRGSSADRPARIHTVGFINPETQAVLRRIAADSGGRFRFIDAVNLGKEP